MTAYLLDTNIWLRSVQREAPQHAIAVEALATLLAQGNERLQAQFPLLDDTAEVFSHWLQLVSAYRVIGRRVHDARVVAAMLTHSVTHLLTFNHEDFRQFPMITVVTPMDVLPFITQ